MVLKGTNTMLVVGVVVVVVVAAGILFSYPNMLSGLGIQASNEQANIPVEDLSEITETISDVTGEIVEDVGIVIETEEGIGTSDEPAVLEEGSGEIVIVTEESATHTVEMSSSGFSPSQLTVKSGDTVTFMAVDSSERWPASAFHPTHKVYPGSSITKCGGGEADEIFDACKDVSEGESYSFVFNEVGEWGYHDHSDAGITGKITVTE